MAEKYEPTQEELAALQNAAMLWSTLSAPPKPPERERNKVKEPPRPTRSREREER